MSREPYVSAMPESYYARWEYLRKRERTLYRKAQKQPKQFSNTWLKASQRLVAHENAFKA